MSKSYIGSGVALITPFNGGIVDHNALIKLVNYVIDGGIDYLVALGTTGEAGLLSLSEQIEVLDTIKSTNNGRVPLVAGNFGGNNTQELINHISNFDFEGIDAILSASPAYVKPSQEGIYQHYTAIAKECPVPIIIYNVPGRTSSNISAETTVRLAQSNPKFIGIKEASGDMKQGMNIINHAPDGFFVTSGDDETALPLISCGAVGVISVIANAFPGIFSSMISAAIDGEFAEAVNLNKSIYRLHQWLYIEGNPVGIKAACEYKGIGSREVRLPLSPLSDVNYAHLKEAIDKIQ